jgi:tetratricopeptide (TPR) repeat protein
VVRLLKKIRLLLPAFSLLAPGGLIVGQGALAASARAQQAGASQSTGAQTNREQPSPSTANASSSEVSSDQSAEGRLLLVLPFQNNSGQPSLDWIGEAVPEIVNRRLASAGFMPISRDDRLYALDHLGLPETFQPSRASAIRLAQTLDADDVIVGSFSTTGLEAGQRFDVSAQILNMSTLHMSPPLREEANMPDLLNVLNTLAWQLAKQLDPGFAVALNTFVAADSNLKVDAFENYVRGLVATGSEERIQHLKEAVRLDPEYAPALMALGMTYFADQQYDLAGATLGRLPADDANAREADFYRGLAYIYTGSYEKAEDAFAFVTRQLPLPEVVNDEGVAASRRGKDATSFFRQAAAADPSDPDYQFNLAVALDRKNDLAGALAAIGEALKLRPQDQEAQDFATTLRARAAHPETATRKSPAPGLSDAASAGDPDNDAAPLERVKRTFNEAAFRQAAFEMDQLEDKRLSALPPAEHAARLTEEGTRYLYQGLILEAEREFQAAIAIDNQSAAAHAGLAAVRERGGDAGEARGEAERSLALLPNIMAYLVLARLDLAANQLPTAAEAVSHALSLEPQNSEAKALRQQLEARGQRIP